MTKVFKEKEHLNTWYDLRKHEWAGSSAWKSARFAPERSRVQIPAGPPNHTIQDTLYFGLISYYNPMVLVVDVILSVNTSRKYPYSYKLHAMNRDKKQ